MTKFLVKSVIFDLDGTLVDTAADLHAATNFTLSKLGRETVPLSAVKADVGYGSLRLINRGLARTGGSDDIDLKKAQQIFLDFYLQNISVHSVPFEGGRELLSTLQGMGMNLGICTNKPHSLAVRLLEELDLLHFFTSVKGGDSYPFKKPDPRHLQETAKSTGEGPYLMIGDASPDILAAQAAGFPVIAANYGYADVPLSDLKPDAIIESLEEVATLVGSSHA